MLPSAATFVPSTSFPCLSSTRIQEVHDLYAFWTSRRINYYQYNHCYEIPNMKSDDLLKDDVKVISDSIGDVDVLVLGHKLLKSVPYFAETVIVLSNFGFPFTINSDWSIFFKNIDEQFREKMGYVYDSDLDTDGNYNGTHMGEVAVADFYSLSKDMWSIFFICPADGVPLW